MIGATAFDVVIVGAGIVGSACADEFARRGKRVAVIDTDVTSGGATAAGMGHIVVMDDSDAQFALTRFSQQLWQATRAELPSDVEYEQRGTIWVAADDEEMQEVERKRAYYTERNVPVEILSASQLQALEPHLRKGLAGGLLVPEDAVLYPPCAAQFLLQRAQAHGANLLWKSRVRVLGNGRAQLGDGTEVKGGILVNATGAWAPELTPKLEIKKRKGHLVITDRYPGYLRHQLVELGYLKSAHTISSDSVAFNLQPRITGQILIGSSRQSAEHNAVDTTVVSNMLQRAQEYVPELSDLLALRAWTGFRAATPDKLPWIGPMPHDPTLFVATGHEGLGITTSLATARLLIDFVSGVSSPIPLDPYLPSRAMKEHAHA